MSGAQNRKTSTKQFLCNLRVDCMVSTPGPVFTSYNAVPRKQVSRLASSGATLSFPQLMIQAAAFILCGCPLVCILGILLHSQRLYFPLITRKFLVKSVTKSNLLIASSSHYPTCSFTSEPMLPISMLTTSRSIVIWFFTSTLNIVWMAKEDHKLMLHLSFWNCLNHLKSIRKGK